MKTALQKDTPKKNRRFHGSCEGARAYVSPSLCVGPLAVFSLPLLLLLPPLPVLLLLVKGFLGRSAASRNARCDSNPRGKRSVPSAALRSQHSHNAPRLGLFCQRSLNPSRGLREFGSAQRSGEEGLAESAEEEEERGLKRPGVVWQPWSAYVAVTSRGRERGYDAVPLYEVQIEGQIKERGGERGDEGKGAMLQQAM